MQFYDIFNGDADGIISLHQYRMDKPQHAELITGVKRDVELTRHCTSTQHGKITVFDISLLANKLHMDIIMENHNNVEWYDHHEPGDTKYNDQLVLHVDTSPVCCTNIIIDNILSGKYRPWTICGAYGDNLHDQALKLNPCFDESTMNQLREVGETLNYNGYGNVESDLTVHPRDVYLDIQQYESPFEYRKESIIYNKIYNQMKLDAKELESSEVLYESSTGSIILLPETSASIRYSGIYSNQQTTDNPTKAYAIFTSINHEMYRVSIRSPKISPAGASKLAMMFPTGGGREKAAGINELPKLELNNFIEKFEEVYST